VWLRLAAGVDQSCDVLHRLALEAHLHPLDARRTDAIVVDLVAHQVLDSVGGGLACDTLPPHVQNYIIAMQFE
jgi:hypothetical protein